MDHGLWVNSLKATAAAGRADDFDGSLDHSSHTSGSGLSGEGLVE